jgi:hypothetical protein
MKSINLKQQISAWKNNRTVLSSDARENETGHWNFYDWFCKDSSLRIRAERLMPKVIKFIKANPDLDLEKHYVFFKNNCPLAGPTYDDFRICDLKTGNVVFTVVPTSSHSGKAEIWGSVNGFDSPLQVADQYSELFKPAEVVA